MEAKLGFLSLFLVVVVTFGQDTFLQETDVSHKASKQYGTASFMSNLSRMEERLDHKMTETERRLMRRLNEKLHVQSQSQSQTALHLQTVVQQLSTQVEQALTNHDKQEQTIKHLRQQVTRQQRELHKVKNTGDRLRKTVANLSTLVEELLSKKWHQSAEKPSAVPMDTNSSPSPLGVSSTRTPFTPIFAEGETSSF